MVTVCSNGALTGRLALDPPSGERVVLLYRLFTGKVLWKENDVLRRYPGPVLPGAGGRGRLRAWHRVPAGTLTALFGRQLWRKNLRSR